MPDKPDASQPEFEVTDAEADAVLAEFGGDARKAIRALLHDVAALARGFEGQVSRGTSGAGGGGEGEEGVISLHATASCCKEVRAS